jgi:hypothetical protein
MVKHREPTQPPLGVAERKNKNGVSADQARGAQPLASAASGKTSGKNGEGGVRTHVGVSQQIYSLPPLATRAPHHKVSNQRAFALCSSPYESQINKRFEVFTENLEFSARPGVYRKPLGVKQRLAARGYAPGPSGER